MKTKRRHELQTNELADWLGQQVEGLRPYWQGIAGVAVVLAAGGALWLYLASSRSPASDQAVADLYGANTDDPAELRSVYERHPTHLAGRWALLTAADRQAAEGQQQLFREPRKAAEVLTAARDAYKDVAEASSADPWLKQRALFGLAQVYEGLHQPAKAREAYREARDLYPDKALQTAIDAQLAGLAVRDQPDALPPVTKMFYDRLAAYQPPPPPQRDPTLPGELGPFPDLDGGLPLDLGPAADPVTPPTGTPPTGTPPTGTPPTGTPPTGTPPTGTPPTGTPPADAPPAEAPPAETPSTETPPTDAPPTDTPPAETPPAETPPTDAPPAEAPPAESPAAEPAPPGGADGPASPSGGE